MGQSLRDSTTATLFKFIVYIQKDGRLKTTPKKKKGKLEEPQNPVWESPKEPPAVLKCKIAGIIDWVKDAEAGRLTESEIARGPTRSTTIQDLETGMNNLGVGASVLMFISTYIYRTYIYTYT